MLGSECTFFHSDVDFALCGRLAALLTDERVPLVTKFVSALDQFAQPFQMFKVSWLQLMALTCLCNTNHQISAVSVVLFHL